MSMLAAGVAISLIFIWWQNTHQVSLVLPNDEQKREMLGIDTKPSVLLTPL
ncbi:hypothetical protein [Marinomonas epiphytica]